MVTTMKDVAKQAGVSVATVSRVLNNTGFVSEELKERVQDAMQSLNYHPSNVARSLRRQQTQTVAVMVPQLDQPFFSTLTFAIQQRLFEYDYYVFTCSTMESSYDESAYIEMLLGQRVDGVIIAPTGHSADNLRRLLQMDIPVVLVDRDIPEVEGIDRVLFDNHHGGYIGMKYLIELGHKNITVVGGPVYSRAIARRITGARAAAAEYPEVTLEVISPADDRLAQFELGHDAAERIMDVPNPPTAIFALTDTAAVGMIHSTNKLGISLPDELSIMGFDNIPLAKYSLPALTTVAQPIHEMGQQTANILLERLNEPEREPQQQMNEAKLIVRDSTQPPKR